MEPLSAIASIASIIGGVATIAQKVSTLKQNWDHAELYITQTASLLFSVQRALEALRALRTSDGLAQTAAGRQLDQDLTLPLESCAVLVALIDRQLEGVDLERPNRVARMRFVALKETFEQAERSLTTQAAALQLLIAIYQCGSLVERTKPLNHHEAQKALQDVYTHTASLALDDKDLDDAASMISKDPSVKFDFDHEILQTKQYRAVYKDLYLRYRPESSHFSPRVSTLMSGGDAGQTLSAGTMIQSTSQNENPDRPPAVEPQPLKSNTPTTVLSPPLPQLTSGPPLPGAHTSPAEPPQSKSLLSPNIPRSDHSRKRSNSSTSRSAVDQLIGPHPELPFLGIPFQGEAHTLGVESSEESGEEDTPLSDEPGTSVTQSNDDGAVAKDAPPNATDPTPSERLSGNESDVESAIESRDLEAAIDRELSRQQALRKVESGEARHAEQKPTTDQIITDNAEAPKRQEPSQNRVFYTDHVNDDESELYGISDQEDDDPLQPNRDQGADPTSLRRNTEDVADRALDVKVAMPPEIPQVILGGTDVGSRPAKENGSVAEAAQVGLGLSLPERKRKDSASSSESYDLLPSQRLQEAVRTYREQNRRLAETPSASPKPVSPVFGVPITYEQAPQLNLPRLDPNTASFKIDFGEAAAGRPKSEIVTAGGPAALELNLSDLDVARQAPVRSPPPLPPKTPLEEEPPRPPNVSTNADELQKSPDTKKAPPVPPVRSRYHRKSRSAANIPSYETGIENKSSAPAPRRPPPPPPPRSAPLPPVVASIHDDSTSGTPRGQSPDAEGGLIAVSPTQNIPAEASPIPEVDRIASPVTGSPQPTASDHASTASTPITSSADSAPDASLLGTQTADTSLFTADSLGTFGGTDSAAESGLTGGLTPIASTESQQQKRSILSALHKSKPKPGKPEGSPKPPRSRMPKPRISKSFLGLENSTKQKIFHAAAEAGNKSLLLEYLQERSKLAHSFEKLEGDHINKTALMRAAAKNHVDCIEALVIKGADYGTSDKDGRIALHYAVEHGSLEAVRFFAERFLVPTVTTSQSAPPGPLEIGDNSGFRPLHIAAGKGYIDIIRILLTGGALINSSDNFGRTALYAAMWGHHLEAFKLLVQKGADVKHCDHEKRTVLMWAAETGADNFADLILERGVDRHAKDAMGNQAVHLAAGKGHVRILEKLYLSIDDLEVMNGFGERPLHLAAGEKQDHAVKALLTVGVTTTCFTTGMRKTSGKTKSFKWLAATPLHYACAASADNVVEDILNHSPDKALQLVNANQEDGTSALMLAAQASCFPATRALLEHGANPNAKTTPEQLTALHYAIRSGDLESTQLLARNGAEIMATNKKGQTPYQYGTNDVTVSTEASTWLWKHRRAQLRSADVRVSEQPRSIMPLQQPPLGTHQAYFVSTNPYPVVPQPYGSYVPLSHDGYVQPQPFGYYSSSAQTDNGLEPPSGYTPRRL